MQPKETSRIETNQADAKTKADLMSKDTVQLTQAGLRADNKHAQKRSTDQTLKQAEARLETDKTKQVASKSTDQAPKLVDADKTKQSVSKSTDKTSKEVDTKLETDETKQRAYKQSIGQTPKLAELKSDVDRNKRDTASSFTGQSPVHAEARSETGKTKYVPSREAGQTPQQAEFLLAKDHKMTGNGPKKLRLITYLSPGLPVDIFELIRDYLEAETGLESYLIYESRWSGPPPSREDPFTGNYADLAFMCSTGYMGLLERKNSFTELCLAAPVIPHPMAGGRPVYFSDVIIRLENKTTFKDFQSLKGAKWAFNDEVSLSGNLVVLAHLKKMGYNASFFGYIMKSGSHLKSIDFVLNNTVDAAAIDSTCLSGFMRQFPEKAKNLYVLDSFGPMPIQPVVFNSRLPENLKEKITKALLSLASKSEWSDRLREVELVGFQKIEPSLYKMENEIQDLVKNMSITPAYY